MRRPAPREVAFVLTGSIGVAALFLPFVTGGGVPIRALVSGPFVNPLWAAACVLAVPVLASTVRQALFGPLTKWEVRAAYALAFAALSATTLLNLAQVRHFSG
ncbi:MAG: hypothetical protein ACYTKD_24405 [Planctomycetota bacterium]|jgi:hypothetical protein